jgi:hypothetical protein
MKIIGMHELAIPQSDGVECEMKIIGITGIH